MICTAAYAVMSYTCVLPLMRLCHEYHITLLMKYAPYDGFISFYLSVLCHEYMVLLMCIHNLAC